MPTVQDSSIGGVEEVTYKTGLTPSRWWEFMPGETLDWNKTIVQGKGLRVGGRVARSGRRVVPFAQGGGDFSVEVASKGMGLLWDWALGANVYGLVSALTYQGNFTIGDTPKSMTLQKGVPEFGGTVDAYTFLGCMCGALELTFASEAILEAKFTVDAGDISTVTAYAAPSYATAPNLLHFANGQIYMGGTLTAPTATTLATVTGSPYANIRGGSVILNNNLDGSGVRANLSNLGRKLQPKPGLRTITGKLDIEYADTTFAQAVIAETPMCLVLNYTGGSLGVGLETLQVVIPEIKFDSELPKVASSDGLLQAMTFEGLDNLAAATPMWLVTRSADTTI